MKKEFFLFFSIIFQVFIICAQEGGDIKKPALGLYFLGLDIKGADYIRSNSLSAAFKNDQVARPENINAGLAISYQQGLSGHFDFSVNLAGSYLDYSLHNGRILGQKNLLVEADVAGIAKLFTDKHFLNPYIQGGAALSSYNGNYGLLLPAGIGLQSNFYGNVYLLLNAQYRFGISSLVNDHFYYGLGIIGNIGKKKSIRKAAVIFHKPPVINYDRDKDGIPDSVDACPDKPGLKEFQGCPDTDGDGIPDNKDKCPFVPGFERYKGCPVPDTDGDGINDENDSCPLVPGVVRYRGCPVPDRDGDGINDEEDSCIEVPGIRENNGCPLISKEMLSKLNLDAKNILFENGSYILLKKSFLSLDDIIVILNQNRSLKLTIEGHTDMVGTVASNQRLSEQRAAAVLDYLAARGRINKNRLRSAGYGCTRPVANNNSSKGKALNRRVEFKISY